EVITHLSVNSPGWVTHFSIHAIAAILSHRGKKKQVIDFLEFCQTHPYLTIYSTILEEEKKISLLSHQGSMDFDDTLQYYVAKKNEFTLITLDSDFSSLTDIRVMSPDEWIHQLDPATR
ncbi:MAG: hypothetical protein Q8O72_00125, partial [Bacteroidales bacterium]|nr:hypothetical protein [Bacteroidales bacterium]